MIDTLVHCYTLLDVVTSCYITLSLYMFGKHLSSALTPNRSIEGRQPISWDVIKGRPHGRTVTAVERAKGTHWTHIQFKFINSCLQILQISLWMHKYHKSKLSLFLQYESMSDMLVYQPIPLLSGCDIKSKYAQCSEVVEERNARQMQGK